MHPVIEAATTLREALKSVADVNPTFMTTSEKATALAELVVLESQVAELRLRVMAVADDVADRGADRDVAGWFSRTQRLRRSDCAADLRLARTLDAERPHLARAVREGQVSVEQARVVAAALADLPARVGAEVVEQAEEALVGFAAQFGPNELARLGRAILTVVAPEVAEAEEARRLAEAERHAAEKQRLRMRAIGDGTTRLSAVVPDHVAARLATYLHAFTNPRLAETPAPRVSHPRRLAEAFGQLLECWDSRRLPVHGGDATTVVVTVELKHLVDGLGGAALGNAVPGDGFDSLSAAQARRLACTATIVPAVLGSDSVVLDLGRGRRLFDRHQRRAMVVRDRTCRAEGCTVPASWCEAHHLVPWSQGGRTDLDDGVLLCSHHHHRVHDPAHEHERLANGDLRFRRR